MFQHEARPGAPGAAYEQGGGARLWQAEEQAQDRAAGAEAPR
ncbi:hypothetical protein [Actinomadura sediminis]|uniref:Uncharacterized protein n=1 Tax=Actinomadura sediminis TaxID=1038904 RepID=A0ABW3EYP7_9ACTN